MYYFRSHARASEGWVTGQLLIHVIVHIYYSSIYMRRPLVKNHDCQILPELGTLSRNSQRDTMVRDNCAISRITVLLVVTFNTVYFTLPKILPTAEKQS